MQKWQIWHEKLGPKQLLGYLTLDNNSYSDYSLKW